VQRLPDGGNRFRWVYQMAGMRNIVLNLTALHNTDLSGAGELNSAP
jgi:hypothetical protein